MTLLPSGTASNRATARWGICNIIQQCFCESHDAGKRWFSIDIRGHEGEGGQDVAPGR